MLCGFLVIFTGVYLLNLANGDPDGHKLLNGKIESGVPTDGIASIQTRLSMQHRRSLDAHRMSVGSNGISTRGDRERLMDAYDQENGFGLTDLTEDSDGESSIPRRSTEQLVNSHPHKANGHGR